MVSWSRAAVTPWRPASRYVDGAGEFRAYLEEALGVAVAAARRVDALSIDGALTAGAATSELVATIGRAGPFGAGNPEPVLALPSHTIAYAEEVGQAHVRVRLRAGDGAMINAIAFPCGWSAARIGDHAESRAQGARCRLPGG